MWVRTVSVGFFLQATLATTCMLLAHSIRIKDFGGRIKSFSEIKPTSAGYVNIGNDGSAMYYAYYEAESHSEDVGEAPIVLWLQGGPGCASTFGGFYELGPWSITPELEVQRNPGAWNRIFALLLVDQPVGSGYSLTGNGSASIPTDEMGMARQLYEGLQGFFRAHGWLAERPLFITGESYAGKYVPSIAHYILQASQDATANDTLATSTAAKPSAADARLPRLNVRRPLPPHSSPPLFTLAGVAVGNGLTDPRAQTLTLAASAYYAGLLPPALRDEVAGRAAAVVALIDEGSWVAAHDAREELRSFITNVTGLATMFDTRRTEDYDPTKAVDRFLNLPEVKEAMRAHPSVQYASCSKAVGEAMSADVMRSVKHLLPDVLHAVPVLLYQGQYDILDGVASVSSWLSSLDWEHKAELAAQRGQLWYLRGQQQQGQGTPAAAAVAAGPEAVVGSQPAAGWWRAAGPLRHVVVYRAGHMVPHDQPAAAQQMLETWVVEVMEGRRKGRK